MAGAYSFPETDGSGDNRDNLRAAFKLLGEAGYHLRHNALLKDGKSLNFEFLAQTRQQERLMLSYANTLERMGIRVRVRQVDTSQYWARLKGYDFDMIQWTWPASLSPGNEQINRWSSKAAEIEGTLNYPGVRSPAADAMIEALLQAQSSEDFTAAVRALDRVLISGDYVIPLFFHPTVWVAYWNHLRMPDTKPLAGFDVDTWWSQRTK
jgi:peptide/nickel transport system substrate-binding protein